MVVVVVAMVWVAAVTRARAPASPRARGTRDRRCVGAALVLLDGHGRRVERVVVHVRARRAEALVRAPRRAADPRVLQPHVVRLEVREVRKLVRAEHVLRAAGVLQLRDRERLRGRGVVRRVWVREGEGVRVRGVLREERRARGAVVLDLGDGRVREPEPAADGERVHVDVGDGGRVPRLDLAGRDGLDVYLGHGRADGLGLRLARGRHARRREVVSRPAAEGGGDDGERGGDVGRRRGAAAALHKVARGREVGRLLGSLEVCRGHEDGFRHLELRRDD